jgi:hypothetical protein
MLIWHGTRFFSPHTLISFVAAIAILWCVVRQLAIDPASLRCDS